MFSESLSWRLNLLLYRETEKRVRRTPNFGDDIPVEQSTVSFRDSKAFAGPGGRAAKLHN